MIEKIIIDYLAAHKRLVVPQLGAFIVKQPDGKIVFSELLKRDDGVLRGLLCAGGMTELQAMGVINRLVFDVRDAVGRGDRFEVKELGAFYPAPNHTIRFVDAQSLRAAVARAAAEETEDETGGKTVAAASRPVAAFRPAVAEPVTDPSAERDRTSDGQDDAADPAVAEDISSAGNPPKSAKEALKESDPDPRTPKPRRSDPAVRGLRYGDPMRRRGKSAVDKFLIIAIVIALIAVGIIAYVYVSGREMERDKAELLGPEDTEYVEDQL